MRAGGADRSSRGYRWRRSGQRPRTAGSYPGAGWVVCLGCRPDALVRRLGSGACAHLSGDDWWCGLRELLAQRLPANMRIPFHIDGRQDAESGGPPGDRLVTMTPRSVGHWAGYTYPFWWSWAAGSISARLAVAGYGSSWRLEQPDSGPSLCRRRDRALRAQWFRGLEVRLPDGEAHKTLRARPDCMTPLRSKAWIVRRGVALAAASSRHGRFCCATYCGVPLVMVPTSLLAMVDARGWQGGRRSTPG